MTMIRSKRMILVRDDITKMNVDVIVNAANRSLLGGGGVDGAIHRAAGPDLLEECKLLNGCETGSAKLTKAYKLPSKYILHAVGPIWRGGNRGEAELLANVYNTCLSLASQNNCKSLAFPNISTGVYGYPKEEASQVVLKTVRQYLKTHELPEKVFFVCFDTENYHIYQRLLETDV